MIQVTVYNKNNEISAFDISGHANSGPYGYDLVCAAVSAVSFGAVNAVYELADIDLEIDQAEEGGLLAVTLPANLTPDKHDRAQLIFEAMLVSLQTIAREYSQFIQIKRK